MVDLKYKEVPLNFIDHTLTKKPEVLQFDCPQNRLISYITDKNCPLNVHDLDSH